MALRGSLARSAIRVEPSGIVQSSPHTILLDSQIAAAIRWQQYPRAFVVKRVFDVVASFLLLLVLLPLLILICGLILAQRDRGTVLFRQQRVGRFGRHFTCFKFRSMCPDADVRLRALLESDAQSRAEWHQTHKLRSDPRVTRLGNILRSTSLDELPQLWNVLRGDMSLVGPRPITQREIEGPYVEFDGCREYLTVRPGITGLWQVSGRSLLAYENRVALDKLYVRNFSLVKDVTILFRTVGVVLLRHGAC